LRTYFGETGTGRCGHCDNCLTSENGSEYIPADEDISRVEEQLSESYRTVGEVKMATGLSVKKIHHILKLLSREDQLIKDEKNGVRFRLK